MVLMRGGATQEEGSASIVAVAVVTGTILVTTAVLLGCGVVVGHQRAVAAADASALAAADVGSGLVPGEPCAEAERVAAAGGASVLTCTFEGSVASVQVAVGPLRARSRAGPPPS
ncbi:Rv3654c family TadE-like protein [Rathayibacter agropyri]|uniref:Rv3654c family TadE-like protein n=1 Tax=Rathayibacter agropyri TaxID=1634927 RepID=UPI001FE5FEB4|nr:Rv3654c family TadE-like protein [Rathayibacter agropyri]